MNVNFDKEQGTYRNPLSANWIISPNVDYISYTVNGRAPTMAKYIAYDSLDPPNPFIAVTQDGRGNVVFDGGFPKFYNAYAPAADATFAQLKGAFKFLYNALNFCANPAKVAAGNRNILIIGDASDNATHYRVKSDATDGFHTSFTRICAIAGFTPTFLSTSDYPDNGNGYGGLLNPSFAVLDQFCAVLVMSSLYAAFPVITPEAVKAFVQYREAGNGLLLITDHGVPDLKDINEAVEGTYSAFYRTVNMIAAECGVYFTGNYDRSPVNVGFIRQTYGDHPLYANIGNDEFIHAGGSESKTVIYEFPKYRPNELDPLSFVDGCYYVQVLAVMKDGSVEFGRWLFCVDKNLMVHTRRLYVRENSAAPWIVNFDKGGWQVYKEGQFVKMNSSNTLLWDKANKEWVNVK